MTYGSNNNDEQMMCWREFKKNHCGILSLTSLLINDPKDYEQPLIQTMVMCESGIIRKQYFMLKNAQKN